MQPPTDSKFHHFGAAVQDLEAAMELYRDLFGYELVRGPIIDPIQKVRAAFVSRNEPGHPLIELVSPASDDSPISTYLKRGIGGYHVCYEVRDLAKAIEHSESLGCKVIGEPVAAIAFDNRKICWIFTPTRMLIEFLEMAVV